MASYSRKAGSAVEEIPAEVAALPAQVQQQVMAQIRQIRQIEDPAMLEQALAGIEQQRGASPPEMKPMADAIEKAMREQLEKLKSGGNTGGGR